MRLSGYGVELAVKKTEYKAVDDSKVKDDTEGKVQKTDEADEDEVEGFLFGKLRFVDWVHSVHKLKMSDLLIIWHAKICFSDLICLLRLIGHCPQEWEVLNSKDSGQSMVLVKQLS